MSLFEVDKYGQIVPVPEGQKPRNPRLTVRSGIVVLIACVMLLVLFFGTRF
jgi:hypothetical protein